MDGGVVGGVGFCCVSSDGNSKSSKFGRGVGKVWPIKFWPRVLQLASKIWWTTATYEEII